MDNHQFLKLLQAARAGDRAATASLLEPAQVMLRHIARRHFQQNLRPRCSPSDLVQDTLLKACGAIGRFRGRTPQEFKAWLNRILFNNVQSLHRTHRRIIDVGVEHETAFDAPRQEMQRTDTDSDKVDRLKQALLRLHNEDRRILALRFWEEQSFESIGRLEHRSAEAARKACSRAVKKLARELGTQHDKWCEDSTGK